jgi:hypothetical protein
VLHRGAVQIPHPELAVEVGQCEVDQQARYSRRVLARTLSWPVPA